MDIQYLSDRSGKKTDVLLKMPVQEWEQLKQQHEDLADMEVNNTVAIPDWQIALLEDELQSIAQGSTELTSWSEVFQMLKK